MQNIKSNKMQATMQSIPAWQYEQEVKQSRKQAKNMRALRQNRKGMWISGE